MTRDDIIEEYQKGLKKWETPVKEENIKKDHLIDFIIGSLLIKIIFKGIDRSDDLTFAFKKRKDENHSYDIRLLVGKSSGIVPYIIDGYIQLNESTVEFCLSNYKAYFEGRTETVLENDCSICHRSFKFIDNYTPESLNIVRSRKEKGEIYEYRKPVYSSNTDR